jgi:hypothetical protein
VLLLEIAAQGVKGALPASGRAALRPGYNVVAADGAALRRLVDALLHPAAGDGEALARAASASAALRAGLTLSGDDGATWRLVRDFRAAAAPRSDAAAPSREQLQRYDPATRVFSTVSTELAAVAERLARLGAPGRARLAALLAVSAGDVPSRRNVAPAPARRVDPAQGRARLDALRAELERSRDADQLQYRLDGLQTRLFKSEEALKDGERVRAAREAADAGLAELARVAQAEERLGDAAAQLAAWDRANARREEAAGKAAEEREALPPAAVPPAWRDPRVWGAVGAGVAAIAVGAAGSGTPGLRYVALLDIPAFGVAAWLGLRWISRLEEGERAGRRRRVLDELERKAGEQHERDTAAVREALAIAQLPSVAELRDALARLGEARAAAADAGRRAAEWEASEAVRDAREARGRLEEEIREVESRLAGAAGGFVRDPRSVEAEIARVEAELAAPAPEPAVAAEGAAGEPVRAALDAAAAQLGGDPADRRRELATRAAQFAAAMSAQRVALGLADSGAVAIVAGGRAEPEARAAAGDRDLAWAAVRLAAVERALAAGGAVALVDDAFSGLPEGARRVAARILKMAAKPGQIVHATSDPAFREAADHVAG